jgi:hypothetical protein
MASVTCWYPVAAVQFLLRPLAGNAAGVVLWDVRTQEAVGSVPARCTNGRLPASSPGKHGPASSSGLSCVGVQLDTWQLVTGFAAHGSSSGGSRGSNGGGSSSSACWWNSGGEAWGEDGAWGSWGSGHSLEVYDIRAAESFSSFRPTAAAAGGSIGGAGAGGGSSSSSCSGRSGGLWRAQPVLTLPVPNKVTCFQVNYDAFILMISSHGQTRQPYDIRFTWMPSANLLRVSSNGLRLSALPVRHGFWQERTWLGWLAWLLGSARCTA